ncbi:hypothetical protein ONS95_001489 [Cadophora gregata]|uniref:uncharacterized protein n=1 Tax=Cadophora gregata TaxID=51156 RepID=UPI0026DC1A94|nr:uncharacterized protein ONS95_001489 [Cadophora gregata]KAK0111112.1 hypothetical protein ONS95_001489 [Cadophora gregata]
MPLSVVNPDSAKHETTAKDESLAANTNVLPSNVPNIVVEKPGDLAPQIPDLETTVAEEVNEEDVVSAKLDIDSQSTSQQPSSSTAPTTPNFEEESLDDKDIELLNNGFIQLNTHDISLVDQHIRLEKFVRDLQDGVDALWTCRNYPRYKEVRVLLMSWEEDNLGVEQELLRLKTVFSRLYNFDVQCFKIPSQSPARVTVSKVSSLISECGVDSLIIMYYGGHAALTQQSNSPAVWAATDKPGSVKFSSFGVQQVLEEAASDVLLLYDCCYASHPAVNGAGQGVTEVIAACGFEAQAPAVGPHSFTNALIQELEESFNGAPFYAAELHSKILGSLKNWKPKLLREPNGNVWVDEKGQPRYECHKRRTPVHCLLTTKRPNRSIMLAPLRPGVSMRQTVHEKQSLGSALGNNSMPSNYYKDPNLPHYPQVLISVRLEEDYLADDDDRESQKRQQPWLEWFRNIPDAANKVTIHGVYRSYSTLLLLSMSVALWNILPAHVAYSFIGFLNSGNLAIQTQEVPEKVAAKDQVEAFPATKVSPQKLAAEELKEKRPVLSAESSDEPIKFLDPNGHKFLFPFWKCQTWEGIKLLIQEASAMDKELLSFVNDGRYRLFDINETVILPSLWISFIRPGMNITMRVWPPHNQLPSPTPPSSLQLPDPVQPCPTCNRSSHTMSSYAYSVPPPPPSVYAPYWPPPLQDFPLSAPRDSMEQTSYPKSSSNPIFGGIYSNKPPPRDSIRRPTNPRAPRYAFVDSESASEEWSDPETFKKRVEKKWKVKERSEFPQRPKVTLKTASTNRGDSTLVGSVPGSRKHDVAPDYF